jgi:hypothetical protein
MATSLHFVDVSDADLARFSEENENKNANGRFGDLQRLFSLDKRAKRHNIRLPYGE